VNAKGRKTRPALRGKKFIARAGLDGPARNDQLPQFLFMSIGASAFLALVGFYFLTLSLFSAGHASSSHIAVTIKAVIL
jgi:hypothetical protein